MEQSTSISTSFTVKGQEPLDSKTVSLNLNTLLSKLSENPEEAFNFFKGMKVYLQEEGEDVIWDLATESNSDHGLLSENFIYPSNSVYENYDYSGKEFNFYYGNSFGNLKGSYMTGTEQNTNNQNYL